MAKNTNNEYFIQHPKEQLFYKVIAYMMGVMALNSQYWQWFEFPKHKLYYYHRKMMLILIPVVVFLQLLYLAVHYKELQYETLFMIYTILPISFILTLKYVLAYSKGYKTAMNDFMTKIHLYNWYITDKEDFVQKILIEAEQISRWTCFYYMTFLYVCCGSFETVPIFRNLQAIESYDNITFRLEIMVHIWLPFDYEFNFINWVIVQSILIYVGFLAITAIFLFDAVNMVCIFHVTGHIKIFKERVKMKFNNNVMMSQEETEHSLIEISRYYTFITQSMKKIESAFGLNVSNIYMHNLVSGGLFIYLLMTSGSDTGTLISYGLLIPIYLGILVIISFALENIRVTAEDIPDLIYGINWQGMSLFNQKLVLMVLVQVQPTLEFKAAFNIKTGVQPAVNIVKTTFSFYVMLKSTV